MGELAEGEGGTSRKSLPLLSRDRLRPAFALRPAPLRLTAAVASGGQQRLLTVYPIAEP